MKRPPHYKLRARMAELGMSQRQLTSILNEKGYKVSNPTINKKLNNKLQFTFDDIVIISEALESKPAKLFF